MFLMSSSVSIIRSVADSSIFDNYVVFTACQVVWSAQVAYVESVIHLLHAILISVELLQQQTWPSLLNAQQKHQLQVMLAMMYEALCTL